MTGQFCDRSTQSLTNKEICGVTFEWKLGGTAAGANGVAYAPMYELQVLKVEVPEQFGSASSTTLQIGGTTALDWSRAATLEVPGSFGQTAANPGVTRYTMSLAEGSGIYVWRVRAVGNRYAGGRTEARNMEGDAGWTYASSLPVSVVVPLVLPTGTNMALPNWATATGATHLNTWAQNAAITTEKVTVSNAMAVFSYYHYDDSRNWIYQRSYTDDGGQAESMTYANGLGFVAQTQAKRFADQKVVATQTVYDFSGRPALQVAAGAQRAAVDWL